MILDIVQKDISLVGIKQNCLSWLGGFLSACTERRRKLNTMQDQRGVSKGRAFEKEDREAHISRTGRTHEELERLETVFYARIA